LYTSQTIPIQNEENKFNGIYKIHNNNSGHFYIGSSDYVVRRWNAHLSELRRGIHHSHKLQNDWELLGEDNFLFVVLERDIDDLIARETEVIYQLRPEYNTAECAENGMKGRNHSEESKALMSKNRKGLGGGFYKRSVETLALMSANARNQTYRNHKPVIVDGIRFASCSEGAKYLGVPISTFSRRIKSGVAQLAT
jgi:group I intron endonuclease